MTGELILGIDVGTTAVKAGLVAPDGRVLASFAEPYPTRRGAPGVVEQDPEDWVRLALAAMERVVAAGHGDDVLAIGLCSQVNTHVFVGADGAPLRPAILWQDGRAGPEAAELDARVDAATKADWWGAPMPIDASHALSRMLWVARHEPDLWERTRRVMLPKDYCLMRLTGEVASDPVSNVGLVGPDLAYVPAALDLVPGASDRMPPLLAMTQVAGRMRAAGPLAGRPVVCGTMDAWAGLVGAGCAREGAAVYLSGTSEVLGISSARVVPTAGAIVFPEAEGVRVHAAPTQSGGDAQLWFAEAAGLTPRAMSELVAGTPRGTATPLFLPQLEGERAPLWDPGLRGAFLGLSRSSGLGDMARAVYEGVALSARHALETLRLSAGAAPGPVTCGGGGFRSEPWARIRADVLGVPLRVLAEGEPGVLGAASLAAVGAGVQPGLAAANAALVRRGEAIEPRPGTRALYDDLFGLYVEAVAANAGIGRRLTRIGGDGA